MNYSEYLEKLKEKVGNDIEEKEWNMLRSQLNSGSYLGLSIDQLEYYANPSLSYEQREIIKFCSYIKLSEEFIKNMTERVKNHNMPPGEMIKSLLCQIKSSDSVPTVMNDIAIIKELIGEQTKQLVASNDEKKKVDNLTEQLNKKEQEINSLKAKFETEKNSYVKQIERLKAEIKSLNEEKNGLEIKMKDDNQDGAPAIEERNASKGAKKLKKRRRQEENIVIEEKPAERKIINFKIEKLPDDFSLSSYLINSDLSSSQMEVITMAVKFGIHTSLVKQMIDSNHDADQLKQIVELLLAEMQNEQNSADGTSVEDMELFQSEID